MKCRATVVLLLLSISSFCQNIVFEGDSNTRGEFIESPGYWTGNASNYPNQTMDQISGYVGNNIGVNSATSSEIVGNMTSRYQGLVNSNTIFSLFIGINDFGLLATADQVFGNVKTIMAYVRSLGCTKIILSTYPPSDRVPVGGFQDLERLRYNQMLRDSAQLYNYRLAEVAATSEMQSYSHTYYADNIHWNIHGCAVVAKKLSEQIRGFIGTTAPANGTWLGTVSSDVSDPVNWQGGLPSSNANLFIYRGTSYLPEISGTLQCSNITIENGVNINVSGKLKVTNTVLGTGTIDASNGDIEFAGWYTPQVLFGNSFSNNTIKNLIINATVTLIGELNITGAFKPENGIFHTNGGLTLKSSASGTAMVTQGPSGYKYIDGNVKVERFIGIPTAKRSWRLITTPLRSASGSDVSVFDTWQMAGAAGMQGKGTLITGPGANPQTNGLDLVSGSSLKEFNGSNLVSVTNTKSAPVFSTSQSAANKSYFIFVRGDRSSNNLLQSTITTLSASGELQTGDQTFATNSNPNGLALVGNPYASPLDLDLVRGDNAGSNVKSFFYIWDHNLGNNGGFVTVAFDDGSSTYTVIPQGAGHSSVIQSGQAFFVQTNSTGTGSPSLVIKESHKSTSNVNYGFRGANQSEALSISLNGKQADSSTYLIDGVMARFSNSYTQELGDEDAIKMENVSENIYLTRNNKPLSIEGRKLIDGIDTLFLGIKNLKTTIDYQFKIEPQALNTSLLNAFFVDKYLQTTSVISLNSPTLISFSINSDSSSFSDKRFQIVFKSIKPLPLDMITLNALNTSKHIKLNWSIQTGHEIKNISLERSTDGLNWITVAGSLPNVTTYSWMDQEPAKGENYYRLQLQKLTGEYIFSPIASAKINGVNEEGITIFPNPVTGSIVHYSLQNEKLGEYTVRLINATGQVVHTTKVSHNRTFETYSLDVAVNLANGVYQLEATTSDGKTKMLSSLYVH